MRRNCNLELQLFPASSAADSGNRREIERRQEEVMAIFYDGEVCVTDVTEFQARAILAIASKEMDGESYLKRSAVKSGGMSMKRSLQQFLQKRRTRVQATTPYHR